MTVHKKPTGLLIFNVFVPHTQLFGLPGYSAPWSYQTATNTLQLTPPTSEIICVQNVGAKVEMVSYVKK
jgi:hypothetical protein